MRKSILLAALTLLALTAATALAASETTTFSFKQTSKGEDASTGIAFKTAFGDPAAPGGVPAGLKSFKIVMAKGTKIDPAGAVQCKATDAELMAEAAAACPAASKIGTGSATATSATGANVKVGAVIFNEKTAAGKNAFLFLFLLNDAYAAVFDAPVKGNTLSASGLTGALPGGLVVTQFSGNIAKHSKGKGKKRHDLITTPRTCKPGAKKWVNTATFTFVNGDKDTGTSSSPCKP